MSDRQHCREVVPPYTQQREYKIENEQPQDDPSQTDDAQIDPGL